MHIAIVDEELPYPLNSGKRIRTFQLVSRLARRHRISYLCHRNANPDEAHQAEAVFREKGIEPIVVDRPVPPRSGPSFYARLAVNLASPLPYSVATHTSLALRNAIHKLAVRAPVDLWQAEWTPYAELLIGVVDGPKLIMAHNVESQIWQRYHETETHPLRRWYIGHQWHKFARFERRVFHTVDRVVAVSDEDARLIRTQFDAPRVEVVENGVDTTYFQPRSDDQPDGPILFLGSLDWRPNLDAVDQLLDRIFPAVRAVRPTAQLLLVGRNPPDSLRRRIAATPGVELHADVPDVRPFLAASSLMVVPLRIGGGSRLKILEAFAAGTPVVSTRVGAEGLQVENGRHLVIADSIDALADAVTRALADYSSTCSLAAQGRLLIEALYNWDQLAARLNQTWRDLVASSDPTVPETPRSSPELSTAR